jgi:hypothetical protein
MDRGKSEMLRLTDECDKAIEHGDGEDDDADKGLVCVFHIGYYLIYKNRDTLK